jgi:hypothetical protein
MLNQEISGMIASLDPLFESPRTPEAFKKDIKTREVFEEGMKSSRYLHTRS